MFKQSITLEHGLLDGHYFLAISYLGTSQYEKAIKEFQSVLSQDSKYRKNIYLLLAISYKKTN